MLSLKLYKVQKKNKQQNKFPPNLLFPFIFPDFFLQDILLNKILDKLGI